jgi:hypothetical protein
MMYKSIFKAVAVSAVAAFFCVGCGDKNDDEGGNLVCGAGEAWVPEFEEEMGMAIGLIFKSNGTLDLILKYEGQWYYNDMGVVMDDLPSLSYTTNGNLLTISSYDEPETENVYYSVSGNKLTLTYEETSKDGAETYTDTYTKVIGINPLPISSLYSQWKARGKSTPEPVKRAPSSLLRSLGR